MCGNTSKVGDVGRGPGKSSLFFLTVFYPGNDLLGDRVPWLVKHPNLWGVRCAPDDP